jgi:hypothetical protein
MVATVVMMAAEAVVEVPTVKAVTLTLQPMDLSAAIRHG